MIKHLMRWVGLALLVCIAPAFASEPLEAEAGELSGWLVLGDSHSVGTFGVMLDELLRKRHPGERVSYYGASSGSPKMYIEGGKSHGGFRFHPHGKAVEKSTPDVRDAAVPKLAPLLEETRPKVVVIELGTNLYKPDLSLDPKEQKPYLKYASDQMRPMISAIQGSGAKCFWVGPPDEGFLPAEVQAAYIKTYQELAQATQCTYIDSRSYTQYPAEGGDRKHYDSLGKEGVKMAKDWAAKVDEELAR